MNKTAFAIVFITLSFLFWLGGVDYDQRHPSAAWALGISLFLGLFVGVAVDDIQRRE